MATSAARVARSEKRRDLLTSIKRPETFWGLVFLSPWIVGFLLLTLGPMIASFFISFTRYDVINAPVAVGLENYQQVARDPIVPKALWNTLFYTVLHVPLAMGFALALALLLDRVGRAAGFFRTVFYLPSVTPAVATGILWFWILNPNEGIVNRFLGLFGIEGPYWTTDPRWAMPSIVFMSLWGLGNTVVIYFAAIRNVPVALLEAARIDGANGWQQFRHVTLPMITGPLFFTLIVGIVGSMQLLAEPLVFMQSGVPPEDVMTVSAHVFREAFQGLRMGYASALAWLLFAVVLVITFIQVRLSKRWVYYEAE